LSSFAVAALAPSLHRLSGGSTGWLLAVLPSARFLFFLF
jgi:multicomponent Na+:H+ antiporter subunit A